MIADQNKAGSVDLSKMTKAQLLEYAADAGIGGISGSMKKAEIIEAIEG